MTEDNERERMLVDAFNNIKSAIELLDRAEADGAIAAHLDLALHLMQPELAKAKATPPQSVWCN